jgi:hypothetical protein
LAIAVDAQGYAYIAGDTYSSNFPVTINALESRFGGTRDAFIAKVAPAGNQLVFSTYLGGTGSDGAAGIAVDSGGHVYVAGDTASANFPTLHAIQTRLAGPQDAFVAELDTHGGLLFSTYLGGSGNDNAMGVAVDSQGVIAVTGATNSMDFPVSHAIQSTLSGNQDAFVARLNPVSGLLFATYLGGHDRGVGYPEYGTAIDVDSSGNLYVTGMTSSADFPVSDAVESALGGWTAAFIAKISSSNTIAYSTYLGASSTTVATGLRVNPGNGVCATGYTVAPDFPLSNAIQTQISGGYDAFLSCLSLDGSAITFSTLLGGSGSDAAYTLAIGGGKYYVAGQTGSLNFPLYNPYQSTNLGGMGGFFTAIQPAAGSSATHFAVSAPASATGGVPFNFIVSALDASNNVVTSY